MEVEVRYIARRPLKLGEDRIAPGEKFDPTVYGNRNWRSMEQRGDFEIITFSQEPPSVALEAEEEKATSPSGEEPTPAKFDNLDELTKNELLGRLAGLGIEEGHVQGTGSNGYVTVEDLRNAIRSLS